MSTATLPEADTSTSVADRAFERWGIAAYLTAVGLMVLAVLVWLDGVLVYVLDDTAIHLGLADTLIDHGTWGVVAGDFQSASSSPLWTVLVALGLVIAPVGDDWVPLLLNVVAGVGVVVVLGRGQTSVVPARRRKMDVAVLGALVVVALFLPGLALVGMEHTLHMLLVLAAVVSIERGRDRRAYALLALGALTRFETAFVGLGLAVGFVLADGWDLRHAWECRRRIAGVLAAVAVPIAVFALWNRAMGGGWLPNSVLAKGQGVGVHSTATGFGPLDVAGRLRRDPLLVTVLAVAVGYLVLTWGRAARYRVTAIALAVATLLHVVLADVGWHERYQAYLLGVGVYLVLGILGELPSEMRNRALVAVVAVTAIMAVPKWTLSLRVPFDSDEMYRHQYTAGRFLDRYYTGQPVATDQLGYISWFHDGPLTDLAGLGDYEVLRRVPDRVRERPAFWESLAEERHFKVAVSFSSSMSWSSPDSWVLVGGFCKEGQVHNGFSRCFDFWATTPDEVAPLMDHLQDFEPDLPARTYLRLNEWAEFQAAAVRAGQQP